MNDLKVVYSKWYTFDNKQYPFPNGLSDEIINRIQTSELIPIGEYDRISALEDQFFFNNPGSNYYFRNSNFYFHCKQQGIEFVSEDSIGVGTYFYPIEIECNTIQYALQDSFLETLGDTVVGHLKSGKVKLLFVNIVDPSLPADTINEVVDFFKGIQVVFLQGNTRLDASAVMLEGILSLYQTANEMDRYPYETSLGYESDFVRESDITNVLRSNKFLSFNRFMDRPNRTGVAYLALKYNLLPDGYFSFLCNSKDDYEDQLQALELPADPFADAIRKMVPRQIDTHHLESAELSTFFTVTNYKKELYQNSYIHIVTETQFESDATPFFSEKTWRPILNLQPFIYLGNPLSLNTLRILGFKTFNPFIDEKYDLETNPVKRFHLIEQEVKKLSKLSTLEIHEWYTSIKETLFYNQKLLYSYKNYNPICKLVNVS